MENFQGLVFKLQRTYREILEPSLEYLKKRKRKKKRRGR